jgi:integrase
VIAEDRKTLRVSAAAYISDAEARGAMAAASMARSATKEFLGLVKKTFVDEIRKEDIYRFHAALRKRKCGDRTVSNKHVRIVSWLRFAGIDKANIPPKPKYEEGLPTVYEPDQYKALLAAADPYMRICILLALKCGLRDQELRHLEFRDLNLVNNTILVRGKPEWGFRVKDSEQRELPLPDDFVVELRAWQESHGGKMLVLGTENDRPNSVLLESLKQLADEAGLSCGRCEGCSRLKEPGYRGGCLEFNLHKFRRTCLTTLLRNNVDVRTVQRLAGHSDLESTLRYLRPASGPELQGKINAVQL